MSRGLAILMGWALLLAPRAPAEGDVMLAGAGATFPQPLYEKWSGVYAGTTNVLISYQEVGSGRGVGSIQRREVDFGASDNFLTDEEMRAVVGELLHMPTCVGAVVATFHIPAEQTPFTRAGTLVPGLRLTPAVLADIYQGRITDWSHPRLRAINPGVTLPALKISLVHRSDASGTTFLFTDFLSNADRDWRQKVGRGTTVAWPKGLGVEGNAGVAAMVRRIPGSIGYVSMSFAAEQQLPMASILNRAQRFVAPSLDSISKAASGTLAADMRSYLTNTDNPAGYPISGFSYILLYREQSYGGRTRDRATALVDFMWWAIHDGQRHNAALLYAPLPPEAVACAERILQSVTHEGVPVYRRSGAGAP